MKLQVGQMLKSVVDSTTLVVVRCGAEELTVVCGGHEMTAEPPGMRLAVVGGSNGEGVLAGKRYTVEGLEVELLCAHAGDHPVTVNGMATVQKSAKPLPASD